MQKIESPSKLFKVREDETIFISAQGFEKLMSRFDA